MTASAVKYECGNCGAKASRAHMWHNGALGQWWCAQCAVKEIIARGAYTPPKPDLNVICSVCGKSAVHFRCPEHLNYHEPSVNDDGSIEVDGFTFVFEEPA